MGYTPHVVVIGGGAVGTAIARDLAIRGLDVTLLERDTLASGTTGQSPGVLYSGAQFAAEHPSVARTCLAENRILFETARHCIEDTGGLVLEGADGDGPAIDVIAAACDDCGIANTLLSGEELRSAAPTVSDDIDRALRVPDAVVDPFRLTIATARDAMDYGASVRTQAAVTDLLVENGTVAGVEVTQEPVPGARGEDCGTGRDAGIAGGEDGAPGSHDADSESGIESDDPDATSENERPSSPAYPPNPMAQDDSPDRPPTPGQVPGMTDADRSETRDERTVERIGADYVVNVAGMDADRVASLADLHLPLEASGAPAVVADGRSTEMVCSRPVAGSEPDVLAPHGPNTVLSPGGGTIPDVADGDRPVSTRAVDDTLTRLAGPVPSVSSARVLRAYPRRRQQVSGHDRPAAHGQDFVAIDHAEHHDCWGVMTVLGGSLTTHRHVAERVADRVCTAFGISRECRTDELPLPGSADEPLPGESTAVDPVEAYGVAPDVYERTVARLGNRAAAVLDTDGPNPVICESRSVTRAEIQAALADETADDASLADVRIRTKAAMGDCQGGRCGHRLATELHPDHEPATVDAALSKLLAERWDGQVPATWGEQLRAVARHYRLHAETLNRKHGSFSTPPPLAFDRSIDRPGVPLPTATLADDYDLPGDGQHTSEEESGAVGHAQCCLAGDGG